MGGVPKYALISAAFPGELALEKVISFYRGIKKTAEKFGIDIIGGDTNSAQKIIVDVSMCGKVERKNLVLREGAKSGDYIFVTGSLGGSLCGKHLKFTPRLKEARFLVNNLKINSMMDISDGLALDLFRLLAQSKKTACLEEEKIPLSKTAPTVSRAFYDGEDFELLFTLNAEEAEKLRKIWPKKMKTKLTCIGRITGTGKPEIFLKTSRGKMKTLKVRGYEHFKKKES